MSRWDFNEIDEDIEVSEEIPAFHKDIFPQMPLEVVRWGYFYFGSAPRGLSLAAILRTIRTRT